MRNGTWMVLGVVGLGAAAAAAVAGRGSPAHGRAWPFGEAPDAEILSALSAQLGTRPLTIQLGGAAADAFMTAVESAGEGERLADSTILRRDGDVEADIGQADVLVLLRRLAERAWAGDGEARAIRAALLERLGITEA